MKAVSIVGLLLLLVTAAGLAMSFPDIVRYARIKMM